RLSNMLSVSISGEAGIGKSSLLIYLEQQLKNYVGQNGPFIAVYISMDAQDSVNSFCANIYKAIIPQIPAGALPQTQLRSIRRRVQQETQITLEELKDVIENLSKSEVKIVLLLDEFRSILRRKLEFNKVFLSTLRYLYTTSRISLIVA